MSHLNAHNVLPIISALPDTEKHVLLLELEKMLCKKGAKIKVAKKKKKSVLDKPENWLYREENRDILVAKIMDGTF